jgi:outer membrane protein OmpA-like peptidoglycan-associated protein
LEFGPDIAKAALFEAAIGSPPVGLLLSIPGVTQVQYYYKGLKNGPEIRGFDLTGTLTLEGDKPKLKLEMDGDVYDGDKNLTLEYMVNYKKENPKFPTWSPFLKDAGDVHESGTEIVRERKTVVRKEEYIDKATGEKMTIEIPEEITVEKEIFQDAPFVTFDEAGTHRNKVKVWQEYEYFWNAHKLTEPKDEEEKAEDKSDNKEIKEKIEEIEKTGKTSFDIEFEPGKEKITNKSKTEVKNVVKVVDNFPQNKFLVVVWSDSLSNKKLAFQRAGFILNELVKYGVSRNRLTANASDIKKEGGLKKKKFHHTKVEVIKK